jgi:hypothetical protein
MTIPHGERVPGPESPHGRAVKCAHCQSIVDLSRPLAFFGWQVVHRCRGFEIEARASTAGGLPSTWRAYDMVAWQSPR